MKILGSQAIITIRRGGKVEEKYRVTCKENTSSLKYMMEFMSPLWIQVRDYVAERFKVEDKLDIHISFMDWVEPEEVSQEIKWRRLEGLMKAYWKDKKNLIVREGIGVSDDGWRTTYDRIREISFEEFIGMKGYAPDGGDLPREENSYPVIGSIEHMQIDERARKPYFRPLEEEKSE